MGYLKWYFGRYGFFKGIVDFFGKRMTYSFFYNIFNGFGLAVGAFFFKRLLLPRLGLAEYAL